MRPSKATRDRILGLAALATTVGIGTALLMSRSDERIQASPPGFAVTPVASPSPPPEEAKVDKQPAPKSKSRSTPWPLRIFASLWFWLAFAAVLLTQIGFALLPPDQAVLDSYHPKPLLTIWASQPNVNLVAVLDDSGMETDGTQVGSVLKLYADTQNALTVRVTSSIPNSIQEASRPWASEVQISIPARRSAYSQVESEFKAGRIDYIPDVLPAGFVFIRADPNVFARAGAHIVFAPPDLMFGVDPSNVSKAQWYQPEGEVVIIAPTEVEYNSTETVGPAFAAPGVWRDPEVLYPIWMGTDPAVDALEQQNLFIAGLVFGIAGSALIASVQELAVRIRKWMKVRRDSAAASN